MDFPLARTRWKSDRLVIRLVFGNFMVPGRKSAGAQARNPGRNPVSRPHAGTYRSRALLRVVLNRVALVLKLGTLGNEALTTFLTTTLDQVPTGFGRHAGTESVLILASSHGRQVGAFHLFRVKSVSVLVETASIVNEASLKSSSTTRLGPSVAEGGYATSERVKVKRWFEGEMTIQGASIWRCRS